MSTNHESYMHRCLQLAQLGAGKVAPNPMVGAVLVLDGQIIGEGWHEGYGGPHAEVNCINNAVEKGFADELSKATIYVSLEPCAHHGKTPPCADLIIHHKIPTVVMGCSDPFVEVDGKGIGKLEAAGVNCIVGILESECRMVNKRFLTFHTKHRPYIVLKWAQTADKQIAGDSDGRLIISNEFTNRLVHQWRSEEAAIMIGTKTALLDDPSLTNRLWPGNSPIRLVIDRTLQLPKSLKLFTDGKETIVFNVREQSQKQHVRYHQINDVKNLLPSIIEALFKLNIQSVLVEGGATLLQSFIDEDIWDEARIITNKQLKIGNGIASPMLAKSFSNNTITLGSDEIVTHYHNDG